MFLAILFFDNETSDVCTVNARFTVTTFNGDAVSTIFTIQTDRAVFTVDNNSGAVFTVNSDGAVFAVSTLLTKHQIVIYVNFVWIISGTIAFNGCIFTVFKDSFTCCNNVFQLTKVNCIRVISTGCYISNLLPACIDAVLDNLRTASDSQAIRVHNSITGSYASQIFQFF